jgi:hypothetical protein
MAPTDAKIGPTSDGKINVMLAHPLNPRDLTTLGVDPDTKAGVGDIIEVDLNSAISLIGSGYVQVDPDDHVAVTAILRGEEAAADVMPSATSGNHKSGAPADGVADVKSLKGEALDEALGKRGLPVTGSADEKRAAILAYDTQV